MNIVGYHQPEWMIQHEAFRAPLPPRALASGGEGLGVGGILVIDNAPHPGSPRLRSFGAAAGSPALPTATRGEGKRRRCPLFGTDSQDDADRWSA